MALFRHIVEHLIPLIFGAILGLLFVAFKREITEHIELAVLVFVVLFALYSTVFEALKRILFFLFSRQRGICGLYAEVYLREAGSVVVAPYLVLHDLHNDSLCVFGRALAVDARNGLGTSVNVSWKSTALALSEGDGTTRELAYLFTGQKDVNFGIQGTTRVGVPTRASGDNAPRRGHFVDMDIKRPVQTGDLPYGRVAVLGDQVEAFRFFSIKFEPASYRAFIASCEHAWDRLLLRLRLFCEPDEDAFRRFLEKAGLKFLADHTRTDGHYQEIAPVLKAAATATTAAARPDQTREAG